MVPNTDIITTAQDHGKSPIETPSPSDSPKHVVIVMDGLKAFSMDPLEWVLKNVDIQSYYIVTLLGVKPWLNIPLSSKTRTDIWTSDLEGLSIVNEKSDIKYQKFHTLKEICNQYGAKLQVKSEMGFPMNQLAAEQIVGLHATLVVFDRHHQKYKGYYAERIPCNMVMMNDKGDVDLFKGTSLNFFDSSDVKSSPSQSPTSATPSRVSEIAEQLKRIFKQ